LLIIKRYVKIVKNNHQKANKNITSVNPFFSMQILCLSLLPLITIPKGQFAYVHFIGFLLLIKLALTYAIDVIRWFGKE